MSLIPGFLLHNVKFNALMQITNQLVLLTNEFLASVIPSLGLLGVAYVGCDKVAVQLLLALPGAFSGGTYAGNQMNHMALSPKYAGTMYGITNAASNMCGFLAPYVIGLLINGRVCYRFYFC